jgi:asparagine synthase (glutamine-hydrolysing)
MSKKILEFAISLPEKWKINQKLYLDWLNQCMPNAADYIWEKTGMKPNAQWKSTIGPKVKKRISKYGMPKSLRNLIKQVCILMSFIIITRDIQNYYQNYYSDNIWRLENYPELKNDVRQLFEQKDFFRKARESIFWLFLNYFSISGELIRLS